MKRILVLLILLQATTLCAATPNQLVITLASDKDEYILGEPASLRCTIENQGDTPLIVACDLSFPDTPCALRVAGPIRPACVEHLGRYEIGAYGTPPPIQPHQTTTLGPIMASAYGAVDAGEYEFWMVYDSEKLGAAGLRALLPLVHAESNHLHIRIVPPKGIDATAFKKTTNECNQAWIARDVLLKEFPSSTYAGYALAHSAPTLTTMESLACLNDVDAALRRYGNRGGGEANTQGHILEAQNEMRAYAKAAGAFLGAHPDFVYAPLIRRMYAMCLGLTGHMPGAMAEIQTLSTGSGKEAAEAQAFLAEKAAAEPKS